MGRSVGHLSHGGRVGVVGKGYGHSIHCLGEHLGERNVLCASPGEVGSVLDFTCVVVSIGGANTYAANLAFQACVGHKFLERGRKGVHERDRVGVNIGYQYGLGQHLAACIHNTAFSGLAADVDT